MMTVRLAVVADAPRIAGIHVRAWHAAYPGLVPDALLASITLDAKTASWQRVLTSGTTQVLAAEIAGDVVGWASIGPSRDPDTDSTVGEVYGMYVDPEYWRRGVGCALWTASRSELLQTFSSITLWVLEANRRARRFYEASGFGPEPELIDKPKWLGVNRVRYRLELPQAGLGAP